ncbi:hypothetical protein Tco_0955037 [Tanacetum coccineum]|uniref:Uncharacterized protein n=1 Tax=Tanacetum coccineum TaxID=301880 RepID=A0ABQ5E621_9ASTR
MILIKLLLVIEILYISGNLKEFNQCLYDGNTLNEKHPSIYVVDSEETLILAEESRLKMKTKQDEHNDKPVDYSKLNKLYEYFVPKKQLSAKQAYWLPVSKPSVVINKPIQIVPKQLLKTIHHVKEACESDVIPFVIELRNSLTTFEQELHKEVFLMKHIFEGMETEVNECSVKQKYFKIEKKRLLIKNDRLLEENISCGIMCTFLRSLNEVDVSSNLSCMFIDNYAKCESLEIEFLNQRENSKLFNQLLKHFAILEEYCISIELSLQHNKDKMICNESWKTHDALLISEINNKSFEINDLKDQLQEKSIVVNEFKKLKDENVSLAFQVSSLVKEREHLKLRTQLYAKFSENKNELKNTSVNTKFENPSTSGHKIYVVTPFLKTQFIPKVVEKNDFLKTVTSHFTTNKVIEKCTKVLAPSLLRIESEPINAYFRNNSVDKSVKQKEKIEWKPTGRIFHTKRHKWLPTGRIFSRVGTKCPLTKITPATIVPSGNIITTTVILSVEPIKQSKRRYDNARIFLTKAYINSYSHPLNEHEFGLHQLPRVQEQNLSFGYLGVT